MAADGHWRTRDRSQRRPNQALLDNRYERQSTVDGIVRATNILLAGKNFVIAVMAVWAGLAMPALVMGQR